MPLLTLLAGGALAAGDILRLAENYDAGPNSGPVDLLVYDPRDDECGLGLVVASGAKAGLILHIFPLASRAANGGLSVDWLLANWDKWFVFTHHPQHPIPSADALVLFSHARSLPQEI